MSLLNVVDRSGWIEYLADTDRARHFAIAIDDTANLIVPVITVYEVFKKFKRERGEADAFDALSAMRAGRIIDIDALVLEAARHPLPLTLSHYEHTFIRSPKDFDIPSRRRGNDFLLGDSA